MKHNQVYAMMPVALTGCVVVVPRVPIKIYYIVMTMYATLRHSLVLKRRVPRRGAWPTNKNRESSGHASHFRLQ